MKYRIVIYNATTGNSEMLWEKFNSKAEAVAFANDVTHGRRNIRYNIVMH